MLLRLSAFFVTAAFLFMLASPNLHAAARSGAPTPVAGTAEIADITSIDSLHGWALWLSETPDGMYRADLTGTTDGGRTWVALSSPNLGRHARSFSHEPAERTDIVHNIRFADSRNGWAFNSGLFATHDGGKTWTDMQPNDYVMALAPFGASVWMVTCTCLEGNALAPSLIVSTDTGRTWKPAVSQPILYGLDVKIVRTSASDAWIAYSNDFLPSVHSTIGLVMTPDGGRSWSEQPNLCGLNHPLLAADRVGQHLWYLCSSVSMARERKILLQASDRGRGWSMVADSGGPFDLGAIGNLSRDYVRDMAAQSRDRLWLIYLREGLKVSTDSGQTWQQAAPDLMNANPEEIGENGTYVGAGPKRVLFTDPLKGWLVVRTDIYRTTDGGQSWKVGTYVGATSEDSLPTAGVVDEIGPALSLAAILLMVLGCCCRKFGHRPQIHVSGEWML